ncbi:hypothetical protein GOP47_0014837 [Adiantum capillus-veneris]|uniref:Uncharacterized protein n=1 Tax=Adiantum capillus-veneris TaxID=13818 RepID=A0A9D4ZCV0_ADICA|nr:hypothetical protein GOP47_0014837 [Adiantum capillus-veneris]
MTTFSAVLHNSTIGFFRMDSNHVTIAGNIDNQENKMSNSKRLVTLFKQNISSKKNPQIEPRQATGLMKEIIYKLSIEIDVPEDLMTVEDGNRLLQLKTPIKPYILEMLHYGYNVVLEDLLNTMNNDTSEILASFKRQCNDEPPSITEQKLTWQHNKDIYKSRFGSAYPYAFININIPPIGQQDSSSTARAR